VNDDRVLGYNGKVLARGDADVWRQERPIQHHKYYGKIKAPGPSVPKCMMVLSFYRDPPSGHCPNIGISSGNSAL
jgi:hypothetical protein